MSHAPAPESTPDASQPESGPVSDRDAQGAREARYAKALGLEVPPRQGRESRLVEAALAVADAELAPLVARVAELEAEVERLTRVALNNSGGWQCDTDRAERAEAAVARVEALADEWTPNPIHEGASTFGYAADRIRAALAAAGPAVSDGEPDATDERALGITVPCPVCGRTDGKGVRFHLCPPTHEES